MTAALKNLVSRRTRCVPQEDNPKKGHGGLYADLFVVLAEHSCLLSRATPSALGCSSHP